MKFRPCIDIHDGKVKQIVGSSLEDLSDSTIVNHVSDYSAEYYANMFKKDNISGGHIIILNKKGTPEYDRSFEEAIKALKAYPGGMQIGGGITDENAKYFLDQGASHVIVTSFVFQDSCIYYVNLNKLVSAIGKEKIVLDLSCRKRDGKYYIVTDRWQKFTDVKITRDLITDLSQKCDEFLIHAADVEGKVSGIEEDLVRLLGKCEGNKITYAGGISSYDDIKKIHKLGRDKIDYTVGSALDIYGGEMSYERIIKK